MEIEFIRAVLFHYSGFLRQTFQDKVGNGPWWCGHGSEWLANASPGALYQNPTMFQPVGA